ncbi:hypothetical protein M8818_005243 [Zalaria obscura]|uniref:Uncharacterized protein n=1 Tax=Zalaria obscura TaxID=2024903 RepID=A0ACC3S9H6_9PEZI
MPDPSSSLQTTHLTTRSLRTTLLQTLVKPFRPRLVKSKREYPAGSPRLQRADYKTIEKHCTVTERQTEGIWLYDITSRSSDKAKARGRGRARSPRKDRVKRRLYYFCGGGWSMPPSGQHWKLCAELALRTDAVVTIVSYPLAPHSAAPVALPQLMRWYRAAMRGSEEEGQAVTLAGDSSGGNIALALVLRALREDEEEGRSKPGPGNVLAISPAVDLLTHDAAVAAADKLDPVLTLDLIDENARRWVGGGDAGDPAVSPVYADVGLLAKRGVELYGITGSYDVLTPDALRFRDRCQEAGVQGEWLHWEKQMHCFPLAWIYRLPESVRGKDWILDVLRR